MAIRERLGLSLQPLTRHIRLATLIGVQAAAQKLLPGIIGSCKLAAAAWICKAGRRGEHSTSLLLPRRIRLASSRRIIDEPLLSRSLRDHVRARIAGSGEKAGPGRSAEVHWVAWAACKNLLCGCAWAVRARRCPWAPGGRRRS